jgi:predicted membrane-bound mannosyltransferase
VAAVVDWLDSGRPRSLVLAALALGLLATVKETYVLTLAGLALGGGLAWARGHDPISRPRGTGTASPFPVLRDPWAAIPARTARQALLAFAAPYVLLYSSFFTHPRGLPDSLATFVVWARKGIAGAGHAKPWDYFLRLLLGHEPLIVCCALAGGWLAFRRRDAFGAACAVWAASELLAYSLLPYKTPWLVLNVLLPAVLVAGVLCREAAGRRLPRLVRAALATGLAVGLGWSAWRAVEVAFLRFDDPRLPLVYAPTHRSYPALVDYVRAVTRPIPGRQAPAVRIYGSHAWPLPWHLRDLPAIDYVHEIPARPDGDLLIVEQRLEERLRPLLRHHYRRRRFLLRPGAPLVAYVGQRLAPPTAGDSAPD